MSEFLNFKGRFHSIVVYVRIIKKQNDVPNTIRSEQCRAGIEARCRPIPQRPHKGAAYPHSPPPYIKIRI